MDAKEKRKIIINTIVEFLGWLILIGAAFSLFSGKNQK